MSEFLLYKSNGQSLRRLGIVNKTIYFVISTVIPIVLLLSFLVKDGIQIFILIFYILLFISSITALIVYSKHLRKNLEVIGELKVNASLIRKSISGIEEDFDYSRIKQLEVKLHMRKIFLPSNFDRSLTYLVTLEYEGRSKEQFVISSQSKDTPEVNFIESVRRIEKYLKMQLLKQRR